MRIDSHSGIRGKLYADHGNGFCVVPKPVWFDQETGEYEALRVDIDGKAIIAQENGCRRVLRYQKTALSLKFEHDPMASIMAPVGVAEREPGQETLLPSAGARYKPKRPCQVPTCTRPGVHKYATTIEELLPALEVNGERFERARLKEIRYYCDWHYQAAQLVDSKGELVEKYEDVTARPE